MYLAYCDDEEVQLEYLKKLAEEWADASGVSLTFSSYKSGEELLFEHDESFPFDLLILDIDMKGINGMTLAKKIRRTDARLPLLFLTNKKEYVFEGYEVNAFRYLLKPVDRQKLFPLLDELQSLTRTERRYLVESIDGQMQKIPLDTILYLEARGHYTAIHTEARTYELKKSLSQLDGQIQNAASSDQDFIFSHRSYLVNLAHVDRVLRTECILSDGSSVPVSRNAYKTLNEAFIRYYAPL
ncbi:MAG: response regulator transcription factor [Clostridiales bacterium]|nr:response regulator transcription factor [Clostridiales bacterium]